MQVTLILNVAIFDVLTVCYCSLSLCGFCGLVSLLLWTCVYVLFPLVQHVVCVCVCVWCVDST